MARILVVDDDIVMACMVEEWLLGEGHTVNVVNDGLEGWDTLQRNDYDLVVLDWDMPGITGVEILRKFRQSGGATPVIMLTGHKEINDKELGFDAGANDYLTKPFHLKELSVRIKATLRDRAAAPPPPKPLGANNEEVLKRAGLMGTALAAKYEFLEIVGEGGFALVLKARHPYLDKMVAVKMLHSTALQAETIARFEQEAKAISRLEHPQIVLVYDFGITERRQPFMVIEFIEGETIEAVLQGKDYLPLEEAIDIMIQVCDGLAHAHEKGILHRDIKPSNIMLRHAPGQKPVAKVLDFGLAELRGVEAQQSALEDKDQQAIGTPPYMSPEQIEGKPQDERSDIYSCGCVLFEMATGYPPHAGKSLDEIFRSHLAEPPLTFQQARPEIVYPQELERLVEKALAKDPADRLQTMRQFKEELEKISS